jgi:hypothetical protein
LRERLDDCSAPGKATLKLLGRNEVWSTITVRSDRPGSYSQNRFDLENGATNDALRGLELIPTPV